MLDLGSKETFSEAMEKPGESQSKRALCFARAHLGGVPMRSAKGSGAEDRQTAPE